MLGDWTEAIVRSNHSKLKQISFEMKWFSNQGLKTAQRMITVRRVFAHPTMDNMIIYFSSSPICTI